MKAIHQHLDIPAVRLGFVRPVCDEDLEITEEDVEKSENEDEIPEEIDTN